jgi:hypothetical protein
MADEEQANKARDVNARDLLKKGVHAIGVEAGKDHGKKGWVVVAHVAPEAKVNLPSMLSVSTQQGDYQVPLVAVSSEPFKPE